MDYTIKAHPTRYAGVTFRSRLEATWAAFFDQLGWAWDYEPIDLNGWVPDFVLRGAYRDVFVEVKPTPEMAKAALPKALAAASGACVAIVADGIQDRHSELAPVLANSIGWVSTPYTRERAYKDQPWRVYHHEPLDRYDSHIDGECYLGWNSGLDVNTAKEEAYSGDSFNPFVSLIEMWNRAADATRWNAGDKPARLQREDRLFAVSDGQAFIFPRHPYMQNFDVAVIRMPNGSWEARWRDFSTVKQEWAFPTEEEAKAAALGLRKAASVVDLRHIAWEDFKLSDHFWKRS